MQGNCIGTDAGGTLNLGNAATGIELPGSNDTVPPEVTIGGAAPGAGNIISANGSYGISSFNTLAGATIQGNLIGTQGDGQTPLGNRFNGIRMLARSTIGGTGAGEGNVIAYNSSGFDQQTGTARAGIAIPFDFQGVGPTAVRILGNSIFGNNGLGIDLGADGAPRLNEVGDSDSGPNNFQNFPVLTSARTTPTGVSVRGSLNSLPNANYRIEFFGNSEIDPLLHGEGRTFLGFTDVTTDAGGNVSFDAPVAAGSIITSTATDAAGNTSEFSQAIGQLLNISTRLRVRTGENVLIGGFIVTGADPKRVLLEGKLLDPTLQLLDRNGTVLRANDNWAGEQEVEIRATTIPPEHPAESAVVETLPPGPYTAVVRGAGDTTGVALVEVYALP